MLSDCRRPKQASDVYGDRVDFWDIGAGDFFKALEFHCKMRRPAGAGASNPRCSRSLRLRDGEKLEDQMAPLLCLGERYGMNL